LIAKLLCRIFGHRNEEQTLWGALGGKAPPIPLHRLQYYVAVYRKQGETRDEAMLRHRKEWDEVAQETVVEVCERCELITLEDSYGQ
jgi:hypothetical protein